MPLLSLKSVYHDHPPILINILFGRTIKMFIVGLIETSRDKTDFLCLISNNCCVKVLILINCVGDYMRQHENKGLRLQTVLGCSEVYVLKIMVQCVIIHLYCTRNNKSERNPMIELCCFL